MRPLCYLGLQWFQQCGELQKLNEYDVILAQHLAGVLTICKVATEAMNDSNRSTATIWETMMIGLTNFLQPSRMTPLPLGGGTYGQLWEENVGRRYIPEDQLLAPAAALKAVLLRELQAAYDRHLNDQQSVMRLKMAAYFDHRYKNSLEKEQKKTVFKRVFDRCLEIHNVRKESSSGASGAGSAAIHLLGLIEPIQLDPRPRGFICWALCGAGPLGPFVCYSWGNLGHVGFILVKIRHVRLIMQYRNSGNHFSKMNVR